MKVYQNYKVVEIPSIPKGTRMTELSILDSLIFPERKDESYPSFTQLSLDLQEVKTGRIFGYGLITRDHYQSFLRENNMPNIEEFDGRSYKKVNGLKNKIVKGIVSKDNKILEGLLLNQ
jgi:hypothetical protein